MIFFNLIYSIKKKKVWYLLFFTLLMISFILIFLDFDFINDRKIFDYYLINSGGNNLIQICKYFLMIITLYSFFKYDRNFNYYTVLPRMYKKRIFISKIVYSVLFIIIFEILYYLIIVLIFQKTNIINIINIKEIVLFNITILNLCYLFFLNNVNEKISFLSLTIYIMIFFQFNVKINLFYFSIILVILNSFLLYLETNERHYQ